MAITQFSTVRLRTDRFGERGVHRGDLGAVLDVYENGDVEVEFSRPDGSTIAWFAATMDDVEPIAAGEVDAVLGERSAHSAD